MSRFEEFVSRHGTLIWFVAVVAGVATLIISSVVLGGR